MNPKLLLVCTLLLMGICSAQETRRPLAADLMKQNEQRATAVMRTLNTAALTYKASYKEAGYPPTLNSMASDGDSKSYTPEHAGLISEDLGCKSTPCAFHNYLFSYKKTEKGYVVTARPQAYGATGKLSLYSDQTAVIRWTLEDREATADDAPVGKPDDSGK